MTSPQPDLIFLACIAGVILTASLATHLADKWQRRGREVEELADPDIATYQERLREALCADLAAIEASEVIAEAERLTREHAP